MRILVNAIPLSGLLTGISRHLRCLYREMSRLPGVKISYFTGTKVLPEMPGPAKPDQWIRNTAFIWKLPDPVVFSLRCAHWFRYEYLLRKEIRKGNHDLYHETAFFPAKISRIPLVYTIYDLSLITFRDKHPRERAWFFDFFLPRRLKYASHVLTISDFIKSEIIDTLKLSPHTITAVPLAPDGHFAPRGRPHINATVKKLRLPEKYFLFVGSLEPRKNLDLIIKAMARQKDPLPLVMTGWDGWGDKSWLDEVTRSGLEDKVIMPGYVDDETLARLYSGSRGFIYPSLYEGFGLPVVEAMACGCPVICSTAASLPEVAGDAAILVDPHDPARLAKAMDELAADDLLHQQMCDNGLRRATDFSWAQSARQTRRVFEKTIGC